MPKAFMIPDEWTVSLGRLEVAWLRHERWGLSRFRGTDWWSLYVGRLWLYWWPREEG